MVSLIYNKDSGEVLRKGFNSPPQYSSFIRTHPNMIGKIEEIKVDDRFKSYKSTDLLVESGSVKVKDSLVLYNIDIQNIVGDEYVVKVFIKVMDENGEDVTINYGNVVIYINNNKLNIDVSKGCFQVEGLYFGDMVKIDVIDDKLLKIREIVEVR